ncbi:hypothetical protein QTP88_025745 [Uroleucon formosanum]
MCPVVIYHLLEPNYIHFKVIFIILTLFSSMMKVVQTFNVALMIERHLVEYTIIVTMSNIFRDNGRDWVIIVNRALHYSTSQKIKRRGVFSTPPPQKKNIVTCLIAPLFRTFTENTHSPYIFKKKLAKRLHRNIIEDFKILNSSIISARQLINDNAITNILLLKHKYGNNAKLKWQLIYKIISKNNKTNNLNELLNNINANTKSNDRKPASILADNFNDYFINVASDLVTQLKNDANVNRLYYNTLRLCYIGVNYLKSNTVRMGFIIINMILLN